MLDKAKNQGHPRPYLRNLNVRWFDFDLSDLLQMRFMEDELERYSVRKGDLVICEGGYPGRAAVWDRDEPIFYQKALHRVRFNEPLHAKWCAYYLLSEDLSGRLRNQFNGAGIQHFTGEALARFQIPVPPKDEVSRIVAILDEAFEGIATAKANAEKNLQNARELFECHLDRLFGQVESTSFGARLGDLCDIRHGYAFDGAHFSTGHEGQAPILLTPGNFSEDGRLKFSERNTKRYSGSDIPAGFVLDEGDLVVVMTDLSSKMKILGKPAIVDCPRLLHNQRIGRVVGLRADVVPRYVYYFMRTGAYVEGIKRTATGTMVRHTAPKRILDAPIPLPSIERQTVVVEALDQAEEQTERLETCYHRRMDALDELKKSLLHQAFTGAL